MKINKIKIVVYYKIHINILHYDSIFCYINRYEFHNSNQMKIFLVITPKNISFKLLAINVLFIFYMESY